MFRTERERERVRWKRTTKKGVREVGEREIGYKT